MLNAYPARAHNLATLESAAAVYGAMVRCGWTLCTAFRARGSRLIWAQDSLSEDSIQEWAVLMVSPEEAALLDSRALPPGVYELAQVESVTQWPEDRMALHDCLLETEERSASLPPPPAAFGQVRVFLDAPGEHECELCA